MKHFATAVCAMIAFAFATPADARRTAIDGGNFYDSDDCVDEPCPVIALPFAVNFGNGLYDGMIIRPTRIEFAKNGVVDPTAFVEPSSFGDSDAGIRVAKLLQYDLGLPTLQPEVRFLSVRGNGNGGALESYAAQLFMFDLSATGAVGDFSLEFGYQSFNFGLFAIENTASYSLGDYKFNSDTDPFPFARQDRVATTAKLIFRNGVLQAAAVPEPATWAMLIVGFGLVGGSLRLRRREAQPRTA